MFDTKRHRTQEDKADFCFWRYVYVLWRYRLRVRAHWQKWQRVVRSIGWWIEAATGQKRIHCTQSVLTATAYTRPLSIQLRYTKDLLHENIYNVKIQKMTICIFKFTNVICKTGPIRERYRASSKTSWV